MDLAAGAAFLVVLAAWGLRLYRLGAQSLWVDEGFSWEVARQGPRAIFALLASEDRHPPLHYLLLWLTMQVAGDSEFALRFLSVAAGVLAIPLTFRLGRALGGPRVGLVGAALLAIAPFHVWYSQEARMYALLATFGLASLWLWLRLLRPAPRRSTLAGYVAATAAALYSHYYAVFLLPAELVTAVLKGDRRWRRLVLLLAAPCALFAPWLPGVWAQYQRAPHGYQPDLPLPDVLVNMLTTFTLSDGTSTVTPLVVAFAALALLGVLPLRDTLKTEAIDDARPSIQGLILLAWVLAAPVGAYLISAGLGVDVRATGRMYYIVGLAPFLLLVARGLDLATGVIAAGLARLVRRPASPAFSGLVVVVGLALVVAAQTPAVLDQYFGRTKEDFRGAARVVEQGEWPGDTVVLDAEYIYRPFAYYYHGAAPWNRAVVEPGQADAALARQTAGHERVWLVLSHAEFADPDQRVQTWLDQHGTALGEWWLNGARVRLYGMVPRQSAGPPAIGRPLGARLGNAVEVARVDLPPNAAGASDIHVRLVWHTLQRLSEADHAALLLTDARGQVWWQTDRIPVSQFYEPTSWLPGEYLTDYYDIALPLGLPPGPYHLKLKMYAPSSGEALPTSTPGDLVDLGAIQIGPSRPGKVLAGVDLAPGLRLLPAPPSQGEARPGDPLGIELLWQKLADGPWPALRFQLVDPSGKVVGDQAAAPAAGYPFARWQTGEAVRDRETLDLPRQLAAGTYQIRIGSGAVWQEVGAVKVDPVAHQFQASAIAHPLSASLGLPGGTPVAQLLGYDLAPATLSPGATLHLRLYWRARGEPSVAYTVFTHLLGPDGKIYAQRDSQPVGGARPTTDWLTGEVIADDYDLRLDDRAPVGSYHLEIGMYRASDGSRLTVEGSKATSIALDAPVTVR